MSGLNRRQLIRDAMVAASGGVGGLALGTSAPAQADTAADSGCEPPLGPVTAGPDDPRYPYLVQRGPKRWMGSPDYVRVVGSTQQVVDAVQEAVNARKKIAVRSGGHCAENWVDDPAVRVLIDMSGMTQVSYDSTHRAFAAGAGCHPRRGLPAPGPGLGGDDPGWLVPRRRGRRPHLRRWLRSAVTCHGPCRGLPVRRRGRGGGQERHGIRGGRHARGRRSPPRVVVGTHRRRWRELRGGDPVLVEEDGRGDLRSDAVAAPGPESAIAFSSEWPWQALELDETKFRRLIRNHTDWCERNNAADAPSARLYADLTVGRKANDLNSASGQVFGPDADQLLDDYLAALGAGVGTPVNVVRNSQPWLAAALAGPDSSTFRLKIKSAYARKGFSETQLAAIYQNLTREQDPDLLFGSVGIASYGGRINTVASDATAFPHRDTVMRIQYTTAWADPTLDDRYVDWLRRLYREIYADTQGVPDPKDGAYINYPDDDMADPAVNTSGIPWSTFYYKDNYPRLQKIKAAWDPKDVFSHTLGIEAPDSTS